MYVKNNNFVAFTQQSVLSNKHKICNGRGIVRPKSQLLNSQDDYEPNKNFQNEWQETEMQTKKKKLRKGKCK